MAFQPTGTAPYADHIAIKLDLCVPLAGWEPRGGVLSAQLLQAMDQVRRIRGAAPAAVDVCTTCARPTEAITELAYEETHVEHLPESYRYQRLARVRLRGCPPHGVAALEARTSQVSASLCPQGCSPWRF